jgi:hypothetical protein
MPVTRGSGRRYDGPVSNIEVVAQPRIDTLVTDAASGGQRRRTEYTGTVWFGGRPNIDGATVVRPARIDSPFFLPDSLPYRPDPLDDAQVVASVGVQAAPEGEHLVVEARAALVADPRNPVVCWVQLQVVGRAAVPLGVSYRVDVLVAMNGILPDGSG